MEVVGEGAACRHVCLQPPLPFNIIREAPARAAGQGTAKEQSKWLLPMDKRKVCQELQEKLLKIY